MNTQEKQQQLEDLRSDYEYQDGKRVVLTVGVRASFYFWGGHDTQQRAAVLECVEAYEQAYGTHLTWAFDSERHQVVPFGKMPPLWQTLPTLSAADQLEWYAASGDDEAVGDYRISVLTERGWQTDQMSVLSFTLPAEHAYQAQQRAALLALFTLCADKLKPFHGHAGLAAVSTHEQYLYQTVEVDVATRYYGLFIEYPVLDVNHAHNGLKSVDWLTYIGKEFAERAGGLLPLQARLQQQGIALTPTTDGVIIHSDDVPDIAPVEHGIPDALARINTCLRPLRNGCFGSMGFGAMGGELRFARCSSDLWIRRLDAADIWPPASFASLPRQRTGTPATVTLSLRSGEVCTVSGRYRQPEFDPLRQDADEVRQVVLLAGDTAPYWLNLGEHGAYLGCNSMDWVLMSEL